MTTALCGLRSPTIRPPVPGASRSSPGWSPRGTAPTSSSRTHLRRAGTAWPWTCSPRLTPRLPCSAASRSRSRSPTSWWSLRSPGGSTRAMRWSPGRVWVWPPCPGTGRSRWRRPEQPVARSCSASDGTYCSRRGPARWASASTLWRAATSKPPWSVSPSSYSPVPRAPRWSSSRSNTVRCCTGPARGPSPWSALGRPPRCASSSRASMTPPPAASSSPSASSDASSARTTPRWSARMPRFGWVRRGSAVWSCSGCSATRPGRAAPAPRTRPPRTRRSPWVVPWRPPCWRRPHRLPRAGTEPRGAGRPSNGSGVRDHYPADGRRPGSSVKDRLASVPVLGTALAVQRRYVEDAGDPLAAAIAFFGFLSLFPLLLLGVSVAGFVLDDPADQLAVAETITGAIPGFEQTLAGEDSQVAELLAGVVEQRGTIGLIGLATLLLTGLRVINAGMAATRVVFRGAVLTGVKAKLRQLLALVALGLLVLAGASASSLAGIGIGQLPSAVSVVVSLAVTYALD